ncbi:MAG: sigma-54 dependent transcriptional regulator [Sandaracinus sp.]
MFAGSHRRERDPPSSPRSPFTIRGGPCTLDRGRERRRGGLATKGGSVLVVDDDEMVARTTSASLTIRGWNVAVCTSAADMLACLATSRPDAIVLDVQLPDLDGLSVLARIRETQRDPPPVIIVSGYLDVDVTLDALALGAFDVLEKPIAPSHLAQILRAARAAPVQHGNDALVRETGLVGRSVVMQRLREQVANVARFRDLPVLIMGESGTGKELVAHAVHRLGGSRGRMVEINCAAVPETLCESELFGHASGSFTGARGSRIGLLEAAGDGSVLLDEIGEMPLGLQAKLLRALETRSFRRVGSNEDIPLRARVLSATNRSLRGREGEPLRADLFFRLAGYTLTTPALRTRIEDVPDLVERFVSRFAEAHPGAPTEISREAMDALKTHDWPGNVRELRAVLQSAMVRTSGQVLGVRQVAQALHERQRVVPLGLARASSGSARRARVDDARSSGVLPSLDAREEGLPDVERKLILQAAEECNGNLSLAARRLKIPRSTLRDRLRRYGAR